MMPAARRSGSRFGQNRTVRGRPLPRSVVVRVRRAAATCAPRATGGPCRPACRRRNGQVRDRSGVLAAWRGNTAARRSGAMA
jgi:hypothetical protein